MEGPPVCPALPRPRSPADSGALRLPRRFPLERTSSGEGRPTLGRVGGGSVLEMPCARACCPSQVFST